MATHSSTLAWKIPWMEEPDRLQSMGSQRVGHDWATSLIWKLKGTRWFNPTDVGNSSKGGRGYTKQALTQAPASRLPDPEKAFQLYVHEREGIALGVLTQRLGSEPQPVAYLSKRLDPTSWGWPPCLWNLAAIAIMIEDALKLSFGGKLTIFTSHQVK